MSPSHDNQAEVVPWQPTSNLIDPSTLAEAEPGTILLLPDKIDDSGRALYRDGSAGVVKTTRAYGADVQFAWPTEHRAYLSEFGAGEIVANIALAVIGNFTHDTAKHVVQLLRLRLAAALGRSLGDVANDSSPVTVKFSRFEQAADRRLIEGFECSGPADSVTQIIESLANGSARGQLGGES
jgi:hypothetical protein